MLKRRSFMKSMVTAGVAITASSQVLAGTRMVNGAVFIKGQFLKGGIKLYYVSYIFPEGKVKRAWLDGKEVTFDQDGRCATLLITDYESYNDYTPVATAEVES